MNSKNSKTSDSHRLLFYLTDEIDLRRKDKYLLYQALTFTINGKIQKKSYRSNKSKMWAPTWNGEFELPDRWYYIYIRYSILFRIYILKAWWKGS